MKSGFIVLVLAAFVSTGAFAQMSAGGGYILGGDAGGGVDMSIAGYGSVLKETNTNFGGGTFGFFDAKYIEASIAVWFGGGEVKISGDFVEEVYGIDTLTMKFDITSFNFSLLGKYPFAIGTNIILFPAAGIEYQRVISVKYKSGTSSVDAENPEEFSALWFRFGGGIDYSITKSIYLRFTGLYGVRLANKYEKDLEKDLNALLNYADIPGSAEILLGHGPQVKVAVGFKF